MSDLNQKVPLAQSLNTLAIHTANDTVGRMGQSLPCTVVAINNGFVTVNFEVNSYFTLPQIEVPIAMSQYVRLPIQVGDIGFCVAADALLGGLTGLGSGVPDLTPPGSLSALVFVPISKMSWQMVNENQLVMYGPNAVVIRDINNTVSITVNASGVSIIGNVTVQGTITASGDVVGGGISLENHVHGGVQSGGSTTDKPQG